MPHLPHLLSSLAQPFADPGSRTYWPWLVVAAVVAVVVAQRGGRPWSRALRAALPVSALRSPSGQLDVQLLIFRRILATLRAGAGAGGAYWLATRLVMALDQHLPAPALPVPSAAALSVVYSLALFLVWDWSRFVLHRMMHRVPVLWAFHEVHHSAERMTPLTFHRVHPVESLLYDLRGLLSTGLVAGLFFWAFRGAAVEHTLLGVHSLGLVLTALSGNLRHSEVPLRFPAAVERWLLSPAQHQLHHSADPAHADVNFGTWLAVWDRLGGSLHPALGGPVPAFGVVGARHAQRLSSALFAPFGAALAALRPAAKGASVSQAGRSVASILLSALGFGGLVHAVLLHPSARAAAPDPAEPAADEAAQDDAGELIEVWAPRGTPRLSTPSQTVEQAQLEQWEYNDIQRILSTVPSVTVRTEDGFGLRPNIGIRGTNPDRSAKVLLLEDGLPIAPAPYAAPAAYYFPLTQRLTAVEVTKGAAAIPYGPQNIAGVVNLVTRGVGGPGEPGSAIDLSGGSFGTLKSSAWVRASRGGSGLLLEGAHLSASGFKELPGDAPTGFGRVDLMGKGALRLPEIGALKHDLELKLGWGQELSHETYLGLGPDDFAEAPLRRYGASADDRMQWRHSQASLRWFGALPGVDLELSAYGSRLDRQWLRFDGFADGTDVNAALQADPDGISGSYLGALQGAQDSVSGQSDVALVNNDRLLQNGGVELRGRGGWSGQRAGLELAGGLRLHGDWVERDHRRGLRGLAEGALLDASGARTPTADSRASARALAAFGTADVQLGAAHVQPGLRVERVLTHFEDRLLDADPIDATQTVVLPGVNALWSYKGLLSPFAGVHQGYSPTPPGSPEGTLPERATVSELGLLAGRDQQLSLTGFWSAYQNLTGQCTLSGGCSDAQLDLQYNGGAADVRGLELSLHGEAPAGPLGVQGRFDGTWTESSFRTGFSSELPVWGTVEAGDSLPNLPALQGVAQINVIVPAVDHLAFGAALRGRSVQRDVAGQGPIPEAEALPGLLTLDLNFSAPTLGPVVLYANVSNVTNAIVIESFRPYGARPTTPRLFTLGLKAEGRSLARPPKGR